MSTKFQSKLGEFGEIMSIRYLRKKGYKILARNFRMGKYGEIDIIAEKEGVLTFIEVKTRTNRLYGSPCESVTSAKQKKIRRVAEYYLMITGKMSCMPVIAFDVIEIISDGVVVFELNHFPQCF
ncbi:MAG: YraN family protein [Phascolarctobacterium sp.]|nr:YraN family protein [Phascolarctobacterium sp.]